MRTSWLPNLRQQGNVRRRVMPCPRAMPRGWCPCGRDLESRGANANLRPLSCPAPLPLPLPLPHLTASKAARMDRGVARPPHPRQVQPDRLAPAAPPRCVEPPGDMWDGCDPLEVHTYNTLCFLACSRSSDWLYGFQLCLFRRRFLPHVADGRSVSWP